MSDLTKRVLSVLIIALLLGTVCYYGVKVLREKSMKEDVQKLETLFTQINTAKQGQQPPESLVPMVTEVEKIVSQSKSPLLKYANLPKLADLYLIIRQPDKARAAAAEAKSLLPKCLRLTRKDDEKLALVNLLTPAMVTYHILGEADEAGKVRDEMTGAVRNLSPASQVNFMSHMMITYATLIWLDINHADTSLDYANEIDKRLEKMDEKSFPHKSAMAESVAGWRAVMEKAKTDYAQAVEKAKAEAAAKNAADSTGADAEKTDAQPEAAPEIAPEKPGLNFSVDDM